ncbi:class I SAM-dependent methyltransferase [Streptomyces cacaoi]
MDTRSLWEHTLTFFPQFLSALRERAPADATVAVVGASDGKFVLPLAATGHHVIAFERDPVALHGGEVKLPGGAITHSRGLIDRLRMAGLDGQVRLVEGDFLDTEYAEHRCDAVWTSCSWHYSANHRRPLPDFVTRMQSLLRAGGLFGAEFMMPVEQRHTLVEHYTSPEKLSRHFTTGWDMLLTLRTNEFIERPHVGQLHDHTHRMGLLLAARSTN